MGRTLVSKLEVCKEFLHEFPAYRRYFCTANAVMLAEALPIPADKLFDIDRIPEILPNAMLADAVERIKNRLANAFTDPICEWLAKSIYNPCLANQKILAEALARENATTSDDITSMLDDLNQPGHPNTLQGSLLLSEEYQHARGQEEQRVRLAEKLIANLAPLRLDGKDTHADRRRVEDRRKREEQIRAMNLDELKNLREERRLRESDVSEARAIVKSASKEHMAQFQQFAPWPGLYAPRGKDVSEVGIPLTKVLFAQLPIDEQKRLLRAFGPDAINKAIQEATKL